MKTSNMKQVIQMTSKHNPADHFDAEARIAGMEGMPGFIFAVAVASKHGSDVIDQIISYHEISERAGELMAGQRYAFIKA